ncbi:RagB/SusD family nutrient uptake outer membrane protein [Tunicatimonas pelagia]|uniref:RagB/SusD family nutrient uptake outer membrane protein n=1 Tax=Tunicatimonas pelagia TaxID=931531 RepID=UPI0026655587|nr:RagB/SusD family nutrient uptake outer membrane protein [Tunicatimonas pelagia]WKN44033.1 RagB/SusD family nutrient uptake outer membrane protein [Tunicatimonas pelagia]
MKIHNYLIAFALVTASVGCDDFLEEDPQSFINPGNFFQTESDAQAAAIACYDFYGSGNPVTFGWWRDFTYEALHDDFVLRALGNANNVREQAFYRDFGPATGNISDAYFSHFRGINAFNVAIDGISGMEEFEGKSALVAEAKFLRAYSYFILVRLFGRIPLIEEPLGVNEVREIPRSASVEPVYDLIIADLNEGVNNLWETAPAPGRATRWAAMGLLAKVYLTRENWGEATSLAAQVINEGPHELLPVYADIFSDRNENNAESIFELQMEIELERANQVGNWPRGIGPAGGDDFFLGPNWGGVYIASDDLLESFEPGDARRDLISTSVTKADGTLVEFFADGAEPNYPLKRVPSSYIEGTESNNNSGYNYIYLRLGEVYLMAAEAENEANGPADAYQYINVVRERAGLPPLAGLSSEAFRTAVRAERRHELYDERKRYFDLLRWGNLVERTLAVKPEALIQDFHTLWPIPQSAADRNPALRGDQNVGY